MPSTMTTPPKSPDDLTKKLVEQVATAYKEITEANEAVAQDSGTGDSEVSRQLKSYTGDDQEIIAASKKATEARAALKSLNDTVRNLYRTKVLNEDPQNSATLSDEDESRLRNDRKLAMSSLTLLQQYAERRQYDDVAKWANSLAFPQVGSKGTSTVGQKKPRAYVKVDGTSHGSFGPAAKSLNVSVSDLVSAYTDADEAEIFTFNDHKIEVIPKPKKGE